VRFPAPLAVTLALTLVRPVSAQMPGHLEAVELARSRDCVPVLSRLDALDRQLAPLAERSQRLLAIGQAIVLEEREVMDSLRVSDPVEAKVKEWFVADGALAERYVAQPNPQILEQRTVGRDSIKALVTEALDSVQAQANRVVEATGSLRTEAGSCTGAVFVRSAVLEACATSGPSPVCDAAKDSTTQNGPFRFVASAEDLWGLQEFRAWSAPGPLQLGGDGQLGGARTAGLTRAGNVVVSVTFRPVLRQRTDMTDAEAARARVLTDSLGFGTGHPDFVFLPGLAIQASLPVALDEETRYIFHFGEPEDADILWAAPANTHAVLQGVVQLSVSQLAKLQAGSPITLTAIRPNDQGQNDAVYSIELTSLNQGRSVSQLLGYMAQQFPADLTRLVPPDSASAAPAGPPGR
jgi:hypothetical protein